MFKRKYAKDLKLEERNKRDFIEGSELQYRETLSFSQKQNLEKQQEFNVRY